MTAIVIRDFGFHEDPKHPGTGAHFWEAEVGGTRIFLADPLRCKIEIGSEQTVTRRPGKPRMWVWVRGKSRHLVFNPSIPKKEDRLVP